MMRRSLYLIALFALAGVHAAPAPEPNPQPDPADDKPEIIEIIAPAASAQVCTRACTATYVRTSHST